MKHTITIAIITILALTGCQIAGREAATATVIPSPTHTATPTPAPTLAPTTAQSPAHIPFSAEEQQTLEAIADEMEQLRELGSDAPLALAFMTPQELHEWLIEELESEYSPEEIARDARIYAALELLPPDTDLYALLLDLYTEQIAGFFDNETDQMTVVDDQAGLDTLDEITFAHEYVHALQDRFLNLDTLHAYRKTADNEDAIRAASALIEGDAQTATLLYLFNHLDELDPSSLGSIQMDAYNAAPPALREEMMFPYMAGMTFVQTLIRQGGWTAVNEAYAALPQSTEHILHPEKYLAQDMPVVISLPPLTHTLGIDWQLVKENTLGEFMLNLYLDVHLPGPTAQNASAGWGGDRFALYERPADGDTLLLLVIAWDSDVEAAEFATAYDAFASEKYGSPGIKNTPGIWWQNENEFTLLSARDRTVIITGPDAETLRRVWSVLN